MDHNLLPSVQKAYDINRWLLQRVERFSRNYKFTLGDRIQASAIDLCLSLVEATHAGSIERPLYRANRQLDQLRLLSRLAKDMQQLSGSQHEYLSSMMEELGRMIGGWLRSSRRPSRSSSACNQARTQ